MEDSAVGGFHGRRLKPFGIFLVTLIGLKVAVLFALAWHRRFVMDEFVQFGWAKYIPHQIAQLAVQHPKAEGYVLFFQLAHLIGTDARSMLLLGRMEMALVACGTLAIVYALSRSLGESKVRSALIVLILLSFSNFMERIFETRGDPLSVFFAAAALLIAIHGRDRRWWIFAAGVLSGLAFLSTQKAVYFNAGLGLALVADAGLERRYAQGIARGAWLVVGWLIPITLYCFAFGIGRALAVSQNLFLGPLAAASPQIAAEYGGLRQYVAQTLMQNALLYMFCFAGMSLALLRIPQLAGARRVALIFSVVITALVFAHNQPWPYVLIMALPFMALWAVRPIDALASRKIFVTAAQCVLGIAIAASFASNILYFRIDNGEQLRVVSRAESLLARDERYFDGIGMLPDRYEPSSLWLDRHAVLATLRQRSRSDAYRIFAMDPPKIIIWSYRMDAIAPVVGSLIRNSYVQIAPNIRIAGIKLRLGQQAQFNVPISGTYAIYGLNGKLLRAELAVNGVSVKLPVTLRRGSAAVALPSGPTDAMLVPEGDYAGKFETGAVDKNLFADVYK